MYANKSKLFRDMKYRIFMCSVVGIRGPHVTAIYGDFTVRRISRTDTPFKFIIFSNDVF